MEVMRANKNLVEINLISNKLLGYITNFDDHPFPRLLRFGIPVCLNTDDRGMWGSTMTDEYFVAVRHFNLS
jgi:adenosine deaminase